MDGKSNLVDSCFVGEHIKVGTGRSGEGAGLLLQQAARGGAAVPGAGWRKRPFCRSANGGPLRLRRTGQWPQIDLNWVQDSRMLFLSWVKYGFEAVNISEMSLSLFY